MGHKVFRLITKFGENYNNPLVVLTALIVTCVHFKIIINMKRAKGNLLSQK